MSSLFVEVSKSQSPEDKTHTKRIKKCQPLTSILATWEAEIGRITV
jgi:hypothetical protein